MSPSNTYEIICRHLDSLSGGGVNINPDTVIAEEFSLDSIKVLDMLMELEDQFDISIPMNVMADIHTVKDLVDAIDKLR